MASRSEPLLRATALTVAGQIFITLWDYYLPGAQSPWGGYSIMFAGTAAAATMIPAGRFLAVFAGVNIAALCFSMIGLIFAGDKQYVDNNIWAALLFISWIELIVLAAYTGGGVGNRAVNRIGRFVVVVSLKARGRGLAR